MIEFMVCVDPETFDGTIGENQITFAGKQNLKQRIELIGKRYPTYNVCVFRISSLHKLISKPVYKTYTVNENLEVVPE